MPEFSRLKCGLGHLILDGGSTLEYTGVLQGVLLTNTVQCTPTPVILYNVQSGMLN